MLVTKLKIETIVKRDFSTLGYKFSLEGEDEFVQNYAAVILSSLIEFDFRKLTHGFSTFVDVGILDYRKLSFSYKLIYIEYVSENIDNISISICVSNFSSGESEISDNILKRISFIMVLVLVNPEVYTHYVNMGIGLICKDISSVEEMDIALKNELFSYYVGYYIESPKKLNINRIKKPSSMITELFIKLRTPEDIKEAIDIIKRSPELTFSILKFINSAFFEIPYKVSSVEAAIALLGFNNLRKWVNLVFLSSSVPNPAKNLYVEKAVARAYFMEKACELIDSTKATTAYMVGILSFMDVLLGKSFQEIFEDIPVSPEVAEALIEGKNLFAELLDLVRAFEFHDKEKIDFYVSKYNLNKDKVEIIYLKALYEYDRFIEVIH
ncbi:MAG: EAL and HDOD domain-containing protein [Hydrogenobaculum sp.]